MRRLLWCQGLFRCDGWDGYDRAWVQVVNEDGSFTTVVCAESLREAERTAKAFCPDLAFDIHA